MSEATLNTAGVEPNLTEFAAPLLVKSFPVMVTVVPAGPHTGLKLVIVGTAACATVAVPTVSIIATAATSAFLMVAPISLPLTRAERAS